MSVQRLTKSQALERYPHMRDSQFNGVAADAKKQDALSRYSKAEFLAFWQATKDLSWPENYGQTPWETASNIGAEIERGLTPEETRVKEGYRAYNGHIFTVKEAEIYNLAVDKAKRNPSEANLNARHKMFCLIVETENKEGKTMTQKETQKNTVTLVKLHSGFVNLPDKFAVVGSQSSTFMDETKGDYEQKFILPEGLRVAETTTGDKAIFDQQNNHCQLVAHSNGKPQLVLASGKMPVLAPVVDGEAAPKEKPDYSAQHAAMKAKRNRFTPI